MKGMFGLTMVVIDGRKSKEEKREKKGRDGRVWGL